MVQKSRRPITSWHLQKMATATILITTGVLLLSACGGDTTTQRQAGAVQEDSTTDVTASSGSCSDPANWMGCVLPRGDLPITAITMPGSHDAATYAITTSSITANGCGTAPRWVELITAKWARTQSADLGAQAANGSRYFDIRPYFAADNSLSTCHTLEGATFADAFGSDSNFQKFVRSHPNEIFVLDFQHFYAENGGLDSPNRKKQLNAWVKKQLGDVLVPRINDSSKLIDTNIKTMRAERQNVIVLAQDDWATDLNIWPRSANLYSEWNDVSQPALTFWQAGLTEGHEQWPLDLAERELGVLSRAPQTGTLNVLNYILDTNCPLDQIGSASCYSAYALWAGTVSNSKEWLFPRIPSMSRQMGRLSRPAVLMRDVASEGNNAPIWNINTQEMS